VFERLRSQRIGCAEGPDVLRAQQAGSGDGADRRRRPGGGLLHGSLSLAGGNEHGKAAENDGATPHESSHRPRPRSPLGFWRMNVEITPEPSDEERDAIVAALETVPDGTSESHKPWLRESEEP